MTKKLTIKINDPEAVFLAYPKLDRKNFLSEQIDIPALRAAIRPLVKGLYDVGEQVPGVRAYYKGDDGQDNFLDVLAQNIEAAKSVITPEEIKALLSDAHHVEAQESELRDVPEHLRA